jgi:hypothetical protein
MSPKCSPKELQTRLSALSLAQIYGIPLGKAAQGNGGRGGAGDDPAASLCGRR